MFILYSLDITTHKLKGDLEEPFPKALNYYISFLLLLYLFPLMSLKYLLYYVSTNLNFFIERYLRTLPPPCHLFALTTSYARRSAFNARKLIMNPTLHSTKSPATIAVFLNWLLLNQRMENIRPLLTYKYLLSHNGHFIDYNTCSYVGICASRKCSSMMMCLGSYV